MATEYVYVQAHHFAAGEHPWTVQDAYENSSSIGPDEGDIALEIFDETRYVDTRRGWWTEDLPYVWSGDPRAIDAEGRLTAPVWRLYLQTIQIGRLDGQDLIGYEIENNGYQETFEDFIPELAALAEKMLGLIIPIKDRPAPTSVGFLTRWYTEAGKEPDTHIGPGEYYANWDLLDGVGLL